MLGQPKHLYSNITMLKKYSRVKAWKNGCDFLSAIGTHSADQVRFDRKIAFLLIDHVLIWFKDISNMGSTIIGLDPFGFPTIEREWDDGSNSIENAKRRLRVAFQFMSKLGVKYWTFHDRYLAYALKSSSNILVN